MFNAEFWRTEYIVLSTFDTWFTSMLFGKKFSPVVKPLLLNASTVFFSAAVARFTWREILIAIFCPSVIKCRKTKAQHTDHN